MTFCKCHLRGSAIMYKNKSKDGTNNICGKKVRLYRKALDGNISETDFPICYKSKELMLIKMQFNVSKVENDL